MLAAWPSARSLKLNSGKIRSEILTDLYCPDKLEVGLIFISRFTFKIKVGISVISKVSTPDAPDVHQTHHQICLP
jgi:hypothetical protein